MKLNTVFDFGSVDFEGERFTGREWTLSAAGDYGILPQVGTFIDAVEGAGLARSINHLIAADISIANLESALTEPSNAGGPGVRGDREVFMEFHKTAPFTIYSLANNHIRDAGADELQQTLERFRAENILYIGAGSNQAEAEAPLFMDIKGVKLGLLAFAQNENQIADPATPGAAELLPDKVLAAARTLVSQCDVPAIILHEGFEFMNFPRRQFRALCHKLARAGVKLIIGHHSHVPQGIEKIDNSLIFYSLGNFLFAQPHFAPYPWTRQSFVPVIKFSGGNITGLELRPLVIELNPQQVRPSTPEESAAMLAHMKACSELLTDEERMKAALDNFFAHVLMPEFFGFIRETGNRTNGDFSALIQRFRKQVTVHKLFNDFVSIYGDREL
jgi:poly-gamma-glutamate capsule biosynthesis protein CapA/YwtB (metallophosphatase superfamily)